MKHAAEMGSGAMMYDKDLIKTFRQHGNGISLFLFFKTWEIG
jgi:hypothetical protein